MLERIKIIATNPMKLCSDSSEVMGLLELEEAKREEKRKKNKLNCLSKFQKKKKKGAEYETQILEQSLTKIGRLLGLCFGEAGAQIIANIGGEDFSPLIPGNKNINIFGFCDIRGFNQVTEVLEQNIMTFVNQIAEIVHTNVDMYGGASNKNLGEAFLFVWKFSEGDVDHFENEVTLIESNPRVAQTVELAIISYIKCIA